MSEAFPGGAELRHVPVLSLCAGVGGLDLAMAAFGGVTRLYAEIAEAPRAVLEAQMEAGFLHRAPIIRDMATVDWSADWRGQPIDAVIGGIPCQGHSHAGKRLGAKDPRNLWPSMFSAVKAFRPRLVLLENVRGILSSDKRVAERQMPEMLESIFADLASVGYRAAWTCVYASEAGAPHIRDRFFLLAEREPGDAQRLLVRQRSIADGVYDDPARAWPAPRTPSMEQLPHEPPRTTLDGRGRALRLRCLGNAVLPAQAVLALERLREMLAAPDGEPGEPYEIVVSAREQFHSAVTAARLKSWPPSGFLWVHRCAVCKGLGTCPSQGWKAFARVEERASRWAPEGTPWPTATTGGTGYRSGNRRDVWRPTLEGAVQGLGPQRLLQRLDKSEFFALGSLDEANGYGTRLVEPSAPWPTPDASASNVGESPESFEARRQKWRLLERDRNGNGQGTPLGISVHLPWPTPTASDAKASGAAGYPVEERSPGLTLTDAAVRGFSDAQGRAWATPIVADAKSPDNSASRSREGGPTLSDQVREPWPTVLASDATRGEVETPAKPRQTESLSHAATPWGTPTGRDGKDGAAAADSAAPENALLGRQVLEKGVRRGALNPDWVELLMGFPVGWTRAAAEIGRRKPGPRAPRAKPPEPQPDVAEEEEVEQEDEEDGSEDVRYATRKGGQQVRPLLEGEKQVGFLANGDPLIVGRKESA